MYNTKSINAEEFICNEEILSSIEYAKENKNNIELINEVLNKAKLHKGLSHREAALLLACENKEKNEDRYRRDTYKDIFPLYNNCRKDVSNEIICN